MYELSQMDIREVKKLPQCFNPARERYIRKTDASLVYPLGRHIIDEIADEAKAVARVKGCVIYDTELINRYIERIRASQNGL